MQPKARPHPQSHLLYNAARIYVSNRAPCCALWIIFISHARPKYLLRSVSSSFGFCITVACRTDTRQTAPPLKSELTAPPLKSRADCHLHMSPVFLLAIFPPPQERADYPPQERDNFSFFAVPPSHKVF